VAVSKTVSPESPSGILPLLVVDTNYHPGGDTWVDGRVQLPKPKKPMEYYRRYRLNGKIVGSVESVRKSSWGEFQVGYLGDDTVVNLSLVSMFRYVNDPVEVADIWFNMPGERPMPSSSMLDIAAHGLFLYVGGTYDKEKSKEIRQSVENEQRHIEDEIAVVI
jgi:hypothetical protein